MFVCMIRRAQLALLVLLASGLIRPATAAPWIFQASQPVILPGAVTTLAPVDPRIHLGPLYTSPQGAYLQGVYRLSRTQINVRGRTVDQTWHWESWIQGGQQY